METIVMQIEWVPVLVSFVLTFALGWLWYSDTLFGKAWRNGMSAPVYQAPMWMPMSAQAGSTFLLAIVMNMATADGHVGHAVLVAITIAGFIKANGFFSGKTKTAISVDVVYVLVMAAVMVVVNMMM